MILRPEGSLKAIISLLGQMTVCQRDVTLRPEVLEWSDRILTYVIGKDCQQEINAVGGRRNRRNADLKLEE